MKFGVCNIYRVAYDLIVDNQIQVNSSPCEEQLLVAMDFEEAYEMACALRPNLRLGAVHRELAIRSIEIVHHNVNVTKEE